MKDKLPDLGAWILPQPDNEEYVPIPFLSKRLKCVPFGYKVSEDPDILDPIPEDLKALEQAAFQIIYNKDKSKIVQVAHMPIETLRFEKMNEDGEVCGYYYSKDWTKIRKKGYEPVRIPAFGHGEKGEALEIYCIKPYRSGFYYYSPVDYQGGIPYAELE